MSFCKVRKILSEQSVGSRAQGHRRLFKTSKPQLPFSCLTLKTGTGASKMLLKKEVALLKNNEYQESIAEASLFAMSLFIHSNKSTDLILITNAPFSMTKRNDKVARTHQKPSGIEFT